MQILLVSTYDLGHQPFGLASPAAWLRADGHSVVCADLSRGAAACESVQAADLVAFFLPMHTATRLAVRAIPGVRALNPRAHLCCYGLYAPLNQDLLRDLGVQSILGGEFEQGLRDLTRRLARGETERTQAEPLVSLARQAFLPPDRTGLPALARYAQLAMEGGVRTAGYTEASRGCKHLCRHCPIVPVYNGVFRVIQSDVVLADIRQQVAAGAQHMTFGDPDFFNGPGHAIAIVEKLHAEFPRLTYDVTVKIEHLLRHRELLSVLKRTGCIFVTSAVESVDNAVLTKLAKGHTRADFLEAVRLTRSAGLNLVPTFVPFTPWTTWEGYRDLLRLIVELELVEQVAPIQLAIRLLIPAGSRLLELEEIRAMVDGFDAKALAYPWKHADPGLDQLSAALQGVILRGERAGMARGPLFHQIWSMAETGSFPDLPVRAARATVPYLTEPWYC